MERKITKMISVITLLATIFLGVDTQAQNVNIPDANFKNALLAQGTSIVGLGISVVDTNNDGEIQVSEASAYTGAINLSNQNISDLTGIEAFTALTELYCNDNNLSSLDVSQNTALVILSCGVNNLNSLDISQNSALIKLYCYTNSLISLDISQNIALEVVACSNNTLSSLDVTQNVALKQLWCSYNSLSSLDVSQNTALIQLICANNNLNSLNVTNGNNNNMTHMWAQNNTSLTCIQHDIGFNPTTTTNNWQKDATVGWTTGSSCCPNIVNIPDANFKAALLAHGTTITGQGVSVIDTDGDGEICQTEAQAYTGAINVSNRNISNLTGIEAFTSFIVLSCNNNSLTNLNLIQNTTLTQLYCYNNSLSSLDVSQNTALITLNCNTNNLSSLDVSNGNNNNMTHMQAQGNPNLICIQHDVGFDPTTNSNWTKDATASWGITSSCCPNVVHIPDANFKNTLLAQGTTITGPNIAVIDTDGDGEICQIEAQAYTGTINASSRNISDLTGIEAFTALTELSCNHNYLSSLDVSQNTALIRLWCHSNSLSSLNVANGNNNNMTHMWAQNNTSLTCIQHDVGFTPPVYQYSFAGWKKDATASWTTSSSCCPNIVNIPDANFKAALLAHGTTITGLGISVIDTDGDGEICQNEAQAYTGMINVHNQGISDLTGIEAFTALTELNCANNNLNSLDVTQNTALTQLICANNNLNSLDVTQNTALTMLICANNNLSSLDVTQNMALIQLFCKENILGSLDVTQNTALTALGCAHNNLSSLDVSRNTALTQLSCNNNNLSSLDIRQNTALTILLCHTNSLSSLDVSQNTALTQLHCSNNNLSSLNVIQNTALTQLTSNNNSLISLNVANGNNSNMTQMRAQNNPNLSCIQHDVGFDPTTNSNWTKDATASWGVTSSCCPNIVHIPDANFKNALLAHGTTITGANIDVIDTDGDGEICQTEAQAYTRGIDVNGLHISDLTGIEAFTALRELACNDNELSSLDVTQNVALTKLGCIGNNLSSLNVANGNNSNMTYMRAQANIPLTCIQHDVGFTPPAWSGGTGWQKDATASWSDNCGTSCTNIVHIPDANFKAALLAHGTTITGWGISVIDTDNDGEICQTEALAYTGTINVYNKNISDLTGIEAFTALTQLDCINNSLSSLDVTQNTALTELRCRDNNISSLDVSQNTALTHLECGSNNLSSLGVTQNTALTNLNCSYNNLSSLDVTQNTALTILRCWNNNLSSLDVTQNTALTQLNCSYNNLSSLDVTQNTTLIEIHCNTNSLGSLDITQNTALVYLGCSNNNLSSLDVSQNTALIGLDCRNNNLSSLNVANGNNSNMINMWAHNNPSLTCIQHDTGFTPLAWNGSTGWKKDATASWSDNCGAFCPNIVNIPDTNFKAALLAHGTTITGQGISVIDTDGDGEICQTEAQAYTGIINVYSQGISDLTGIEAFTALTSLYCGNNSLNSLDVTQNTALLHLWCNNNQLTNLNVTNNITLAKLHCANNPLTSLDITNNTALTYLQCGNTQLTNLDVTNNVALIELYSYDNLLMSLDITNNAALTHLYCYNNQLTGLNIINNTALIEVGCYLNQITSLDISQNTALTYLKCNNNNLNSLNVANGNNSNMWAMLAHNNPNLTCINHDVGFTPPTWSGGTGWRKDATASWSDNCGSSCTNIVNIPDANFKAALLAHGTTISGPGISVIDTDGDGEICQNEAQTYTGTINVSNQNISDLTGIEAFTALTQLDCINNSLSSLDVTQNTALTELRCRDNNISSLDVSQNTALTHLECGSNNLSSLGVTQNTALTNLNCSYNNLSSLDVTQNTTLTQLNCSYNNLSSLDVTQNTTLIEIHCNTNSLGSLDITQNTALVYLGCSNNNLSSLNVSQNTALIGLDCRNNNLSSLNVANGNNSNMINMWAHNNPSLTCIQHDTGFTPLAWNGNIGWQKDATASWSDNCGASCTNIVNIPDANFKAALLAHGTSITGQGISVIDTDNDGEICQTEAQAYTGTINVINRGISDLTGIEAFTALTALHCGNNSLSSLDVSQNTALTELYCSGNNLSSLDITQNIALTVVNCHTNNLSSLDVSQNTALIDLTCYNNTLSSLDVSQNTALIVLSCANNSLSSLDVSQNTALEDLDCNNNSLNNLNVANGNNSNMIEVRAQNNPNLTCIQHDAGFDPTVTNGAWQKDATASWSDNCGTSCTNIVNIPDANFKAALLAHGTSITGAGISVIDTDGDGEICQNEAQTYTGTINVSNQNISDLTGIEAFTALTVLNCQTNNLNSLDLTQNTDLTELRCYRNNLSSLGITQNIALIYLYCDFNSLNSLNVANGNNSNMTQMLAQNNPNLTCIQHDVGFDPTTNSNWQKDATASWSDNCGTSCTNIVNIPDANFKAALLAHGTTITGQGISVIDTDGDGEICQNEAQTYTGAINVHNQNISDLTGIEAFTALTVLYCINNSLSSLDLTQNTDLTELWCHNNSLSNLDVTQNTALTLLGCANNNLSSLDVTQNTALTYLYCYGNNLSSLDITQNIALTVVNCHTNNLTSLDVSQNTALIDLACYNNTLNSLDVSQNTALTVLHCGNNSLSSLDVSQNTALEDLNCNNNSLNNLNVANGNNSNITQMLAQNNPNLTCIQHDVGFDPTTNSNWQKDATANWSDDCLSTANNGDIDKKQIVIYPNPFRDILKITNIDNVEVINITDINGKKVGSFVPQNELNLSYLSTGVYFINLMGKKGSIKIVKVTKQ